MIATENLFQHTEKDSKGKVIKDKNNKPIKILDKNGNPVQAVQPVYQADKDMNSQSNKFYDEYSQSAQDILFDPDNRAELNKALGKGQSARNKFKSIVNGSYDIRSGKDALTYLANYIDGFQKGKLSQISKRRIANTNKDTKARSEQRSRASENVGPKIDRMAVVKNPDGTPKTRNGERGEG